MAELALLERVVDERVEAEARKKPWLLLQMSEAEWRALAREMVRSNIIYDGIMKRPVR